MKDNGEDFYDEDDFDEDDIDSDIGENEPGMVPTRGPNCQVLFKPYKEPELKRTRPGKNK